MIILGFATFALVVIITFNSSIKCNIFTQRCINPINSTEVPTTTPKQIANNINDYISHGEKKIRDSKVQLSDKNLELKQQNISEFYKGRYEEAKKIFDKLHRRLQDIKNASTTLNQEAQTALKDPDGI